MKRLTLFALALVAVLGLSAQNAAETKLLDPLYGFELYRPYPVENITPQTPAPKGYKPFYISHLSRHGSRWHTSSALYDSQLDVLRRAHEAGELTDIGERYYAEWSRAAKDAEGRGGELSPLGAEQHRDIAHRMYRNYPEIFSTKGSRRCFVDCRSTIVPRCILSMSAAVTELVRLNPELDVRVESSAANGYLKAYAGLNSVKQTSIPYSDSLRRAYMPDQRAFMKRLFREGSKVAASIESTNDFMFDTFLANAIFGSTPHVGINPQQYLFTEEELAAVWRASNIRRYALTGPSKPFADAVLSGIKPLVRNIVETADRAIATGDEQATLRFAHDVTVIPLVAILGIPCGNIVTDDFANVGRYWQCNRVTPMAANIQLVFYRNKQGDVLVKVLHNECEQVLDASVATPMCGVYYRWSDLRAYLLSRL